MEQITEVKLFKEYPSILENPIILKQILLPTELKVLQLFIKEGHPLGFNEVFFKQIARIYEEEVQKQHIDPLEWVKQTKSFQTKNEQTKGKFFVSPWDQDISSSDKIKAMDKTLRNSKKIEVKVPSNMQIKNILETLESWGFITKRIDNIKKKADFFWIINPRFTLKMIDRFPELLGL